MSKIAWGETEFYILDITSGINPKYRSKLCYHILIV